MSALTTLFHEVENAFRPIRSTGVTLQEEEDRFILEALVAGVAPKDIAITMENGALHIEAKSEKFAYSYLIPMAPNQVEESSVEAEAVDGILKLILPKAKSIKPIKISLKNI